MRWLSDRLRRGATKPGQAESKEVVCVVFTVPEKRLSEMDVATGPCVVLEGRKRAIRSALMQDGEETPEHMRALFTVLGGDDDLRESAMQLVAETGKGALYRCSGQFVELMRVWNQEAIRLARHDDANGDKQLTLFVSHREALDAAWLSATIWPSELVGTGNKLHRLSEAGLASSKSQPLYCWYGPRVPMRSVAMTRS